MPLPGNVNAVDRFQRAAYYTALLPTPVSHRQAVASVMEGAPSTAVDPYDESLAGDVTDRFAPQDVQF